MLHISMCLSYNELLLLVTNNKWNSTVHQLHFYNEFKITLLFRKIMIQTHNLGALGCIHYQRYVGLIQLLFLIGHLYLIVFNVVR